MTTAPCRIEIPLFPGNRRIALTSSWDDGTIHDRRLVEILNRLGLKAAFNLNSARFGQPHSCGHRHIDAAEVPSLYAGHEVAMHTRSHPFLDRLDPIQVTREVLDDRAALEDLVGYPVRGMAYPFGTYNAWMIQLLHSLGVVYARTTENRENPWPPVEPLAWPVSCHVFDASSGTLPQRFECFYRAWNARSCGLFFFWGHSYECAADPACGWEALENLLTPLAALPDVWYCTPLRLFDYEAARRHLVVAANRRSAYNPSALSVTLLVDERLVEVPPGETLPLSTLP